MGQLRWLAGERNNSRILGRSTATNRFREAPWVGKAASELSKGPSHLR